MSKVYRSFLGLALAAITALGPRSIRSASQTGAPLDPVVRSPVRIKGFRGAVMPVCRRVAVCLALILLVSAQTSAQTSDETTYKWDASPAVLRMGMPAPQPAPADETVIVFYSDQFADVKPSRFEISHFFMEMELLVYNAGSYRAELVYTRNPPDNLMLQIDWASSDPSNPTGFHFFKGKRMAATGSGFANSPLGLIGYTRFSIPDAVCFSFYHTWGKLAGLYWRNSLTGYVCNTDPAGLSHDDITVILAQLGVRGKEPDRGLAPQSGSTTTTEPSSDDSASKRLPNER